MLESASFTYDLNGNQLTKITTLAEEKFTEPLFLYPGWDLIGNLTKVSSISYNYDKAGNLLSSDTENKVEGTVTKLKNKQTGAESDIPDENIDPTVYFSKGGTYFYNADGIRTKKYTYAEQAASGTALAESKETQYFYFNDTLLFTADQTA